MLENVLDLVDMVVVMTVNPGFGGQVYLNTMEPKIGQVRAMIDAGGSPILLEVDGGIRAETIVSAHRAGADRFISGSGILGCPAGKAAAVAAMRDALTQHAATA
jgi:ribulose-phosphate 3-epimerase